MTLTAAEEAAPTQPNRARGLKARASGLFSIVIAIALALTPVTAVLVLGWFMRIMRRETALTLVRHETPGKKRSAALEDFARIGELAGMQRFPGWWHGLMETLLAGTRATAALAIATLPFGALLLLAWWAGWENSFNKGYEQAWVGPLLALAGVLVAVFVLTHLPMALAHHAAVRRIGAIWDVQLIRRLISRVRWRYLLFTLFMVVASAPVYLAQAVPTFIESVFPHLATAGPEEIKRFAGRWHLSFTVYLVLVLLILRRWSARLYARAFMAEAGQAGAYARLVHGEVGSPAGAEVPKPPRRWPGLLTNLMTAALWFGFIAALFTAQFANHAWWNWVNSPISGLPWVFRPY
ncbi:MAG: hypothetical protein AAGF81_03040 [Pseudomonadota bacterium]